MCRLSWNLGASTSWNLQGLSRPVMGFPYLYHYLFSHLLTYLISSCSRVVLEKLTGWQLGKKFPAFYGTRTFITAFTSARHLSLFWASSIQSISLHATSWISIYINIIFPSTPGSPKWFLSFRFPHQNPVYASPLPHTRYMPRPSYSSRFLNKDIFTKIFYRFLYSTVFYRLDKLQTLLSISLRFTKYNCFVEGSQAWPIGSYWWVQRSAEDEYGAKVECHRQVKTEVMGFKLFPLSLCPQQISHELTWDRTCPSLVTDLQLTAWCNERPTLTWIIQGVSGGIVNILGGGNMDYSQ